MRKIVGRALLVIGGAAAAGALVYALRPQPVAVDAAAAVVGPMRVTVEEEGKTRIRERYVVSSPLVGRLRRVTLDPGDPVEAQRTVLATVEPVDPELLDARAIAEAEGRVRTAEAAVRQSEATTKRVRAAYDFAETELGRVAQAAGRGAATEQELERARAEERALAEELRAAQFGEEIAQYELEVARAALLYARGEPDGERGGVEGSEGAGGGDGGNGGDEVGMALYSPIDGVVLRVLQENAAVVMPGAPLIEVGDARDLELVVDVLSTDAVSVRPGQPVIVEHWGGAAPLEAVVRLVEPSAFTKISALGIEEQRVNVIADFVTPPEERGSLGDGFRVEANIVVWEGGEVLQVPSSAAFRRGDAWAVFVIEDGRAALRPIEPGRQNGRTLQVVSGLEAGERVVLHPSDELEAGVRVRER